MLLICSPSGDHVGAGKLRDLGEFRMLVGGQWPVLCVTADPVEYIKKEEAIQRDVFLVHYKELVHFIGRDVADIRAHLSAVKMSLMEESRLRTESSKGMSGVLLSICEAR